MTVVLEDCDYVSGSHPPPQVTFAFCYPWEMESKRTTTSVMSAIPQTLAYMMANPQSDQAVFGMD